MIVNDTYSLLFGFTQPTPPEGVVTVVATARHNFQPEHADLGGKHGQRPWKLVYAYAGEIGLKVSTAHDLRLMPLVKEGTRITIVAKNKGIKPEVGRFMVIGTLAEE
jgi:hypothetical protein